MRALTRQALALSSGTIAALTGCKRYTTIDIIQALFVVYCNTLPQNTTWQSAWFQFSG